jgi:hypothetical protein
MNRTLPRLVAVLAFALALLGPFAAVADDAPARIENTTFSGALVTMGDLAPRPSVTTVRLRVTQLSPPGELDRLATIVRENGERALDNDLAGRDLGFLQFGDRFPERIGAAVATEVGGHRHLTLILARPLSMREIWRSQRSEDYRLRIVEIDLDADSPGVGNGTMFAASRLRRERHGVVSSENLGALPWRILNLRAMKD